MFDTQDVDCIHKVLCLYCNLYPEFLLSYLLYILILVKLKLVKTKHTRSKHTKKQKVTGKHDQFNSGVNMFVQDECDVTAV